MLNVVVPFGSGSLRESGRNRRGYGLGGRRIQIKASYDLVEVKKDINLVNPTSLGYFTNIKMVRESLDNKFVNPTNNLY